MLFVGSAWVAKALSRGVAKAKFKHRRAQERADALVMHYRRKLIRTAPVLARH